MKKPSILKSALKFTGVILLAGLTMTACKKDDPEKPDTQSVDDNSQIESEFDDILSIAEDVMNSNRNDMDKSGTGTYTLSDTTCATVSLDTAFTDGDGSLGRIEIDFGSTNCEGSDGINRRGKIFIAYTGKYRTTGTKITTTFDNYFVNDHQVEGTKTVEKTTDSTFAVNVTDAKISWTDGTTTQWTSNRIRTWSGGRSTLFVLSDDVYTINGTASGTNRLGDDFTTSINNVEHKIECWFDGIFIPASGTTEVTPAGKETRTIDFGDGICDKTITLTVVGISYEHTFQ